MAFFLEGCSNLGNIGGGLGGLTTMVGSLGGSERFLMGSIGAKTKVKLKTISMSASINANNDSPVELHLLVLYDPYLIADVVKMPSSQYFMKYKQMQKDHRSTVEIHRWQVPPAGSIPEQAIHYTGTPVATFLFARYSSEGDHRLRIGETKDILVLLEEKDFHVVTAPSVE